MSKVNEGFWNYDFYCLSVVAKTEQEIDSGIVQGRDLTCLR